LFSNFVLTAGAFAGLGVGGAATRHIATERSRTGEEGEAAVRHALSSATVILTVLATALVWLFRVPIARIALGDSAYAGEVGWLSIGVGLSIVSLSQTGLLGGLRRMEGIAQTYFLGAALSAIAGIAALYTFGSQAIVWFVILVPMANVLAGAWFVAQAPRARTISGERRALWRQWRQLAGLGFAIMLGQVLANAAQLAVRGVIVQRLGLPELGLFQGAWAISVTYLGVVLQAMAADYYPRLSEAVHDRDAAVRIVNEQTEVTLLLGGPIILVALGLAPLGLQILYSSEFQPAAELLRWQMLGDVLKIASWPASYVLLAANRGRLFLLFEAMAWTIFLSATWLLIPSVGLKAAGIGIVLMYAVYLPVVFMAARSVIGLTWTSEVRNHFLILGLAAVGVFAMASYNSALGMGAGAVSAGFSLVLALIRLRGRLRGT